MNHSMSLHELVHFLKLLDKMQQENPALLAAIIALINPCGEDRFFQPEQVKTTVT